VDTTLDDLQLKQLHTWLGWIKRWAPGDGVQELEVIREEHRDSLYVCLFLVLGPLVLTRALDHRAHAPSALQ
jgi:hypothetical protein